uniref:Formin-2-like n=1 Tax=Phallusia mammillata TaxID=59560 RepID=A0A6F9DCD4_9ASCI|nr:formin-2-like [Phallusia mammillata]
MKPLYWTRVKKIGNVLENTLWYSVPAAEVDHKELVHLFCKNTANKKKSTLSESLSPKKVKVKPAKLLSTKRSQALGIFISSLHMDVEDIKQAVLDLETNVVDVESISAIYDLRPQANELELIKSFAKKQSKVDDNDKQPLDKPEQFLLKLWEVDHCTDRLFCITFMHQFHCNLGHLQSSIALIDEVCKSLQQKSIQQLFGIILTIGNYLNAGNRSRGEAAGFGLDVLSKLKDVKGNTDNLNLLAYVLRVYIKTFDLNIEIALRKSPVPSTLEIVRASQIDYEDIDKAFQKLRKELKDCGHRVDVVKSNSTIHAEPFGTIMHQFLTKATSDVEELEEQISNSRRGFNDTLAYFGVKSTKSSNTKEFFDQWIRFCGDVNDLWHMQLKEILKAQKEQAKQKVEEIRSKTSSVVVRTRRRPRSLKTRLSAHIAADTIEP